MVRVCAAKRDSLLMLANVLHECVRTENTIISVIMLNNHASRCRIFLKGMFGCDGVFGISRLMNVNITEPGKVIDEDRGMLVAPTCQLARLISLVLCNEATDR